QAERTLGGNTLAIQCVALSANGAQIAAGGADKSLTVWNAADAKEVKKLTNLPAAVVSVALNPDGKSVAFALAGDNRVWLFDLAQSKEAKPLTGHAGPVSSVAYTPKGDLLSASADKTLQVWDTTKNTSKAKIDAGAAAQCLAFSRDGARVAAGGADKAVRVWTIADGKPVVTITTPAE